MVVAVVAGCSEPVFLDGQFSCSQADPRCPPGFACDPCTLLCRPPGAPCNDLAAVFDGPDLATGCDEAHPCATGQRCYLGSCIADHGTCLDDRQCEDDSYCQCAAGGGDGGACTDGVCLAWGTGPRGAFDPTCAGRSFAATALSAPVVACHFLPTRGESAAILTTPVVADLDGDGKPEILFSTYEDSGALIAIHHDCSVFFEHPRWGIRRSTQLAVADLDGDGSPEIVGITGPVPGAPLVTVFDAHGAPLAFAPAPYQEQFQGDDASGPEIADADGDGLPEILVSAQLLHYRPGQPVLEQVWNQAPSPAANAHWGTLSAFADVDGDGIAEILTGLEIYGLDGKSKGGAALGALGTTGAWPEIADFNLDGHPDLLVVQSQPGMQRVAILDLWNDQALFGPYSIVGGGWGGPATVADFDGDGVPDFGVAGPNHYSVYSLKCAASPPPPECHGADRGVLWERETRDLSSGGTAASVFDFNGDGIPEVVYRDECWLRVMSGVDGKTLFAQSVTSGTALEMPVVADVDADGHADLIVPSDHLEGADSCKGVPEGQTGQSFTGATEGLFIFRDPQNRWMPSRALWNQHTYHITNIDDDLRVPKHEVPSWTAWNSYRQNVPGAGASSPSTPDFTAAPATLVDSGGQDCTAVVHLWASVCNRGAATADAGVPGTFYRADPRGPGAAAICTVVTVGALAPGHCEVVGCDFTNPPTAPANLWFRADDDGRNAPATPECDVGNDLLYLPAVTCEQPS